MWNSESSKLQQHEPSEGLKIQRALQTEGDLQIYEMHTGPEGLQLLSPHRWKD